MARSVLYQYLSRVTPHTEYLRKYVSQYDTAPTLAWRYQGTKRVMDAGVLDSPTRLIQTGVTRFVRTCLSRVLLECKPSAPAWANACRPIAGKAPPKKMGTSTNGVAGHGRLVQTRVNEIARNRQGTGRVAALGRKGRLTTVWLFSPNEKQMSSK